MALRGRILYLIGYGRDTEAGFNSLKGYMLL